MQLQALLLVGAGGALGSMLRYSATMLIGREFPYGTLLVNVLGSLLMGMLAAWQPEKLHPLRLLLGVGILGGFTTFSAFSLDTITLFQRGETLQAVAYVGASVFISLLALASGMLLMKGIGA